MAEALGMIEARGFAVHGYPSVPAYPPLVTQAERASRQRQALPHRRHPLDRHTTSS